MTDYEIVQSYKNAVNQHEQIKILSELTLKPRTKIVEILERNGIEVDTSHMRINKRNNPCVIHRTSNINWRSDIGEKAVRLRESGYTLRQIAKMMNIGYGSIAYYFKRYRKDVKRKPKWTEDRTIELVRLRDEVGLKFGSIAMIMDETVNCVISRYYYTKKEQQNGDNT